MSNRAISIRDLAFVRDVLIPRCAWVEGPEVDALVQLRLRIDAIFASVVVPPPSEDAVPSTPEEEAPPCP